MCLPVNGVTQLALDLPHGDIFVNNSFLIAGVSVQTGCSCTQRVTPRISVQAFPWRVPPSSCRMARMCLPKPVFVGAPRKSR